jgi:uncharacterized membrane protein YhaH (DUF805 family)
MLGFLFGFNARLGRMHYLLSTIGLAFVMTAVCFAIAGHAVQSIPGRMTLSPGLMGWPTIVAAVVFSWMTFTLQSMRVRDIGWDPVCVIPAWIAILIVDKLVAGKIPAWSLRPEQHGTIVGGLINLALFLALMFWPSGDHEDSPTFGDTRRTPDEPSHRQDTAPAPATRIGRATGAGFGRRAF